MNKLFLSIAGHVALLEMPEHIRVTDYLHNLLPFCTDSLPEGESLLFHAEFRELESFPVKKIADFVFEDERCITVYRSADDDSCFYITFRFLCSDKLYRMRARNNWQDICVDTSVWDEEAYQALNELLMVVFVYSSAYRDTIFIHSSSIKYGDEAVAFIGHSGVGKSTHSRLWLTHIDGCELLNDDQPAVRLQDGKAFIYGTPWSGKTLCFKNKKALLKAFFFMQQAPYNEAKLLPPLSAFQELLASCSMIQDERDTFNRIIGVLGKVVGLVPAFRLKNRPEEAAARLSFETSLLTPLN